MSNQNQTQSQNRQAQLNGNVNANQFMDVFLNLDEKPGNFGTMEMPVIQPLPMMLPPIVD